MPVQRVIPVSMLTPARIQRVVCHWTAGGYQVSDLDRKCYHAILEDEQHLRIGEDVRAHAGWHTPADNDNTGDNDYAAHTHGLNSNSFGLSVACMGDAEPGGPYGRWPLTELLWERQAQAAAEVCHAYHLEVSERTVLQHGEVERVYGRPQKGKWDVLELPFHRGLSHVEVGDLFRKKVRWYLDRLQSLEGR